MREKQQSEESVNLSPIYDKIAELKNEQERNKRPETSFKIDVKPMSKMELLLGVNKEEEFLTRKLFPNPTTTRTPSSHRQPSRKKKINFNINLQKSHTKSARMINFLRATNDKLVKEKEKSETVSFDQEQMFTPIRSMLQRGVQPQISKKMSTQRFVPSSLSKRSGFSSERTSPKKYLRKGDRVRKELLKQFEKEEQENSNEERQLVYLREYDEWVPNHLLASKRQELEQYLNILKGVKVKKDDRKPSFKIIYL